MIIPLLALATAASPSLTAAATEPPPQEEQAPLLTPPELLDFVEAPYPEQARADGVEGTVRLAITVDEQGSVTDVQVTTPAGHGFDEAAAAAAAKLRFSPARDETGPVPVIIEFEYGFTLQAPPAAEAPINLSGVLLELGTGRPVPGASVQATGADGFTADTTTDPQGAWSLRGVPPGPVQVRAALPDYDACKEQLQLSEGERTEVELWIRKRNYGEDEIVAVYQKQREPEVTRRTITVAEVRRVPGTFGDPVRVIQSLPGAARPPFGSGMLVIRGANPEDSAVRIDGVRVPLIYHLGGYKSVINGDLVDSVDYLPGGYGVRYGRSLGGVVDVRTKERFPEQDRFQWRSDLLDSGGIFEGRLGKKDQIGVALAGRRSYIDTFLPYLVGDTGFYIKPRWYDYQAKVADLSHADRTRSVFVFGFGDVMRVGTPADVAQGTDPDTQGDIAASYGSHRVIFKLEQPLGPHLDLRLEPSLGWDSMEFELGSQIRVRSLQTLLILRASTPWSPSEALTLTPGIDFGGGRYAVDLQLPFLPDSSDDPLQEREDWSAGFHGWGWSPDPWLELAWRPLKDPDRLLLNPGLRVSTYFVDNVMQLVELDPRAQLRWRAVPGGSLKGGVGLYHQPPQGYDLGPEGAASSVGMEQAWSSELGWEHALGPSASVDLTVFHKDMSQLIVSGPDGEGVNQGQGRVNGLEIIARQPRVDRLFGWISYTLSRSERKDAPDQDWVRFDFDQTHILTVVAGTTLPYDLDLSARLQHVTGNPYTPYAGALYDIDSDAWLGFPSAATNSERTPPYTALDLRIDKLFTFKRWQLQAWFDLLNAVHGTNPEGIRYNYDYTEHTWINGLPLIPSPGFQAEFQL